MPQPATIKPIEEISQEDFQAFEDVRVSGAFNMMTHATDAAYDAGLDRATYMSVLTHYGALMVKYPGVHQVRE